MRGAEHVIEHAERVVPDVAEETVEVGPAAGPARRARRARRAVAAAAAVTALAVLIAVLRHRHRRPADADDGRERQAPAGGTVNWGLALFGTNILVTGAPGSRALRRRRHRHRRRLTG